MDLRRQISFTSCLSSLVSFQSRVDQYLGTESPKTILTMKGRLMKEAANLSRVSIPSRKELDMSNDRV